MRTRWRGKELDEPIEEVSGGGRRFVGDKAGRPDAGGLARQDLRITLPHQLLPAITAEETIQRRFGDPILRQERGDLPLPVRFRQSADDQVQGGLGGSLAGSRQSATARWDAGSWSADFLLQSFAVRRCRARGRDR